jgi:hypothetical protein
MTTKSTIVIAKIRNQEKQIIVSKDNPFSRTYNIWIDKECQGQVINLGKSGWKVSPIKESGLTDEICETILQAVLNAENPNS